jgi:hypothetical protein
MSHFIRPMLALAAGTALFVAGSGVSPADPYVGSARGNVSSNRGWTPGPGRTWVNPSIGATRPIGSDWWRTYPYSSYNSWRNPYWYQPYNGYYPVAPVQVLPYYPAPFPVGGW